MKDNDPASVIAAQAQRSMGTRDEQDSEALALLAAGLDPANRINPQAEEGLSNNPIPTLAPETTNTPSGFVQQLPTLETVEPGTAYPTIAPLNIPSAEIPRSTPTMFPTLSSPFVLKDRQGIADRTCVRDYCRYGSKTPPDWPYRVSVFRSPGKTAKSLFTPG